MIAREKRNRVNETEVGRVEERVVGIRERSFTRQKRRAGDELMLVNVDPAADRNRK